MEKRVQIRLVRDARKARKNNWECFRLDSKAVTGRLSNLGDYLIEI